MELVDEGKVDADVLQEVQETTEPVVSKKNSLFKKPSTDDTEPTKPEAISKNTNAEDITSPPPTVEKDSLGGISENLTPDKSVADTVIRVNVKILDKIMNIVGELVLNRNQILQYANNSNDHEFTKLSQQLNVITSELQSEVMTTRMQPIGNILTKFERLVRDFSRASEKKITLKLSGQGTELDKTLIEAIKDPLVHIIRNACDHGIENQHERELNGKSVEGTVWIKSYNESGQVTIEIVDDGKGLDPAKLAKKAIEKGLVSADRVEKMTEAQIYNFIFNAGFSTAAEITNISGRGVGMDVVKTNIEKIGGSVSVTSELGRGTTFKLRIPLTLAIVPALIIKSQDESFAIPQLNLVELVRLETKEETKEY